MMKCARMVMFMTLPATNIRALKPYSVFRVPPELSAGVVDCVPSNCSMNCLLIAGCCFGVGPGVVLEPDASARA